MQRRSSLTWLTLALLAAMPVACSRPDAEPAAGREAPVLRGHQASPARGRAVYLAHCALCHGESAKGNGVRARGLATPPADLTRLPPEKRRAERLLEVLEKGVPGTDMPAWRALSDEQLADLVAYVGSLGRARGRG